MRVRKSYIDASKRLRSLDSLNEYFKVMLCDYGVSYSPTVVTEQELGYYIINELKLHGFEDYVSVRTGVPHALDIDYLTYIQRFIEPSDSFKLGLFYVLGYLETKAELDALYGFSSSLNMSISKGSRTYELRKIQKVDEFGRPLYTVRDIISPFNSVQGDIAQVIPFTDIYYKYFEQVTGFRGGQGWSFFKGMSRSEEFFMLHYIFEGHIAPTNRQVLSSWSGYLEQVKEHGVQVYKELEMFIERSQQGIFNAYLSNISEYELKYCNWFSVGLSKKYKANREYPVYLTNIAWDAVLNKPLPVINQVEGIGGEFVYRASSPDDRPFEVTYHDGSKVIMYKVSRYSKLSRSRLNLEQFYTELNRASHGQGHLEDTKLVRVSHEASAFMRSALNQLAVKGVYCVN